MRRGASAEVCRVERARAIAAASIVVTDGRCPGNPGIVKTEKVPADDGNCAGVLRETTASNTSTEHRGLADER
jgi:hypothetical protein